VTDQAKLHLSVSAIDTLMFRDGRPFNQQDEGASVATSIFPPHPPSLVGAIRAAFWRVLGPQWPKDVLGDGTNWQDEASLANHMDFEPGQLHLNGSAVFHPPLHLVEGKIDKSEDQKQCFLRPGPTVETDIGKVELPIPTNAKLKGLKPSQKWLTLEGMNSVLKGVPPRPEELLEQRVLWEAEPRVGIGIEQKSRRTNDGELYMASHIRLAPSVSLDVTVAFKQSFPQALESLENLGLQAVGGEHRMASISVAKTSAPLPAYTPDGSGNYVVVQLSPMVLPSVPKPGESFAGLPGELVCACLGKSIKIGGWDSQNKRPLPFREAIPAGSVWFMRGGSTGSTKYHGAKIGQHTEWGFGKILIGNWPEV
jgi:CRISPR-associated protein Cmr3